MLLTFIVYKTGAVHKTCNPSGLLKKKQTISGIIILMIVFILITSFFILFGISSFDNKSGFL
ncbi:MAG: hypothetical protein JXB50_11360 [Spirochaetes bacterium]|nr:hypothetical protein [Spirochaetota bacterium]